MIPIFINKLPIITNRNNMGAYHTGIECWSKERYEIVNFVLPTFASDITYITRYRLLKSLEKGVINDLNEERKTQPLLPAPYQTNLETYLQNSVHTTPYLLHV